MPTPPEIVENRILSKCVDGPGGCLLWTGTRVNAKGAAEARANAYGVIYVDREKHLVHRWMYERYYGPIPTSYYACHRCHVKNCCEPTHIYAGTPQDNTIDNIAVGKKRRSDKVRCRKGIKGKVLQTEAELLLWISKNIDITDTGCHEWIGMASNGYGRVDWKGKRCWVHRIVYQCHNGVIPEGKVVRHLCANRKCCNIEHLAIGTQLDNIRDAVEAGAHKHTPHDRNSSTGDLHYLKHNKELAKQNGERLKAFPRPTGEAWKKAHPNQCSGEKWHQTHSPPKGDKHWTKGPNAEAGRAKQSLKAITREARKKAARESQ